MLPNLLRRVRMALSLAHPLSREQTASGTVHYVSAQKLTTYSIAFPAHITKRDGISREARLVEVMAGAKEFPLADSND